jgi:hypothetical protein
LSIYLVVACAANIDPIFPTPPPTRPLDQILTLPPAPTLTETPPPQATFTPLPPPTATPIVTITPGPSPTALIGATSRIRPTLTTTPTRRVAQSGSLVIEYFTTDATEARPGDKIRVFWSVKGVDSAFIYRIRADGAKDFTWSVGQAGYQDVTIGLSDKDQARFMLAIGDAFSRLERSLTVPIAAACSQQGWYFAPPPATCPAAPAQVGPAAIQRFERGLMLWSGVQGRIFVLYTDGKQPGWASFADEFKDGMKERDGSLSPPAGLTEPIRGFGLIWRDKADVRPRLGWALAAEQGYNAAIQADSAAAPDTVVYLQGVDGSIYALTSRDMRWKAITASTTTAGPTPKP